MEKAVALGTAAVLAASLSGTAVRQIRQAVQERQAVKALQMLAVLEQTVQQEQPAEESSEAVYFKSIYHGNEPASGMDTF